MNAEPSTSRPRSPLPEQVGRYQLLTELGNGATAKVFLARVAGLGGFNRLFAVKMIHDHLAGETKFIDLFLNEARIASRIHHPNVVAISDVGIEAGSYYLGMDYVVGETLTRLLQQTWNVGKSLPIEVTLQIVLQCCEGLHAAHELKDRDGRALGVVHRDVAPQNIMVGYDGVVRLMDFGIAKAVDQLKTTRPGVWRGTLPYMAPEQIRADGPLDRRVDVFALGIVLWESTVGQRLFKAKRDLDTLSRVLELDIPRPSASVAGYPRALEAIIMRALERDPERRFPTTRALGEELREFIISERSRVATAPIETLMKQVFAERFLRRTELERMALKGADRAVLDGLLERGTLAPAPGADDHSENTEDLPPEVEADTLELPELERPDQSPTKLQRAFGGPTQVKAAPAERPESITRNTELETLVLENAAKHGPKRRWSLAVLALLVFAAATLALKARSPEPVVTAPAITAPPLVLEATPERAEVDAAPAEAPVLAAPVLAAPEAPAPPPILTAPFEPEGEAAVNTPPPKLQGRREGPRPPKSSSARSNSRRRGQAVRPPESAPAEPTKAPPSKPKPSDRTKPLIFEGEDL